MIIKAKLEAVESEIRTIEQEFMGDFVLADGRTVSECFLPRITQAIEGGQMPRLALPGPDLS